MSTPDPAAARPAGTGPKLFFTGSVVLYLACWVVAAVRLPERVPLHFGGSGQPDRWGGRGEALIVFAVLGVVLVALFGAVAFARFPIDMVNVPHKEWWTATPERVARLRGMIRDDALRFATATMVLLSALILLTLRASLLDEPRLDAAAYLAVGAYLAWTLGYTWRIYRGRYRPEE